MMTLFLKKIVAPFPQSVRKIYHVCVQIWGTLFYPLPSVKTSHMEPAAAGVVTRPNGKRRRRCRQKGF